MSPVEDQADFRKCMERMTPRRIMANARSIQSRATARSPNWVLAMDLYSIGSTYAHMLCAENGIDPDSRQISYHAPLPRALLQPDEATDG